MPSRNPSPAGTPSGPQLCPVSATGVSLPIIVARCTTASGVQRTHCHYAKNGIIIDGYARWELARRQGRQTIPCLEYDLTDEEALRWLIQSHRPSRGLNSYSRVLLALDLEPRLQERARANQQAGGQNKGRQI